MHVDALYDIEINSNLEPQLFETIEVLKEAINDWPEETATLNDFLTKVRSYLRTSEVTIEVINKELSTPVSMSALWERESLTSMQKVMALNDNEPLDNIINGLVLSLRLKS